MRKEPEGIGRISHGRTFLFDLWVVGIRAANLELIGHIKG
jgi:hypothetical protein